MKTQVIIFSAITLLALGSVFTTAALKDLEVLQAEKKTQRFLLELALAKTENRALAQKLAACQTVVREPKPILNF